MPAGPSDETDQNKPGQITEKIAKEHSSKTESNASSHPAHKNANNPAEGSIGDKVQFRDHAANPGPQVVEPKEFNVQQEGSREDRKKREDELNK